MEQCGKDFTGKNRRNNLARHLKTHTGEKPFTCPACPYRASRKEHMIRHMRKGSCVYHKYKGSGGVTVPAPSLPLPVPKTASSQPQSAGPGQPLDVVPSGGGVNTEPQHMEIFLKEIVRLSMNGKMPHVEDKLS